MTLVDAVLLLALIALLPGSFFSALIDLSFHSEQRFTEIGRGKSSTVLLILLTGGVGGLYYWFRIRPELRAAA